jgi:outer membrane protein
MLSGAVTNFSGVLFMRNLLSRFFLFAGLLALFLDYAVAQQAVPPGELLTLDQAVAAAVANSSALRISTMETEKIQSQITAALTKRRPSSNVSFFGAQLLNDLKFTYRQGEFGSFPSTGPVPPQDMQVGTNRRPIGLAMVQVDQPLTQLKKIDLGVAAQRLNIESTQEKARKHRQDLAHQVRQIYYQILQNEAGLESSDEISRLYAELDRSITASVAQSTALRADALQVKALIAEEDYRRVTLRNAIDEGQEALNRLMGRDLRTRFRTQRVAEMTAAEVDLAMAQAQALSQRSEIRQAQIRVKQAEADHRLKESERRPDLSLSFRYLTPINTETLPRNITMIGFNFSWEPWDWGRRKAELREKETTTRQTNETLSDTRQQILAEVSQRFRKLEQARAGFRMIDAQQEAAREKLRVLETQYAAQTVLLKEVLQAQVSVAGISQSYQQALIGFWNARSDFEASLGTDQ